MTIGLDNKPLRYQLISSTSPVEKSKTVVTKGLFSVGFNPEFWEEYTATYLDTQTGKTFSKKVKNKEL